jgi:hypothetical protein
LALAQQQFIVYSIVGALGLAALGFIVFPEIGTSKSPLYPEPSAPSQPQMPEPIFIFIYFYFLLITIYINKLLI